MRSFVMRGERHYQEKRLSCVYPGRNTDLDLGEYIQRPSHYQSRHIKIIRTYSTEYVQYPRNLLPEMGIYLNGSKLL